MKDFFNNNKETIFTLIALLFVLIFIVVSAKAISMLDSQSYNNVVKKCKGEMIMEYTSHADKYWACIA